jgi:hypothetical protein
MGVPNRNASSHNAHLPHIKNSPPTGLKGRIIIAQGKRGADERRPGLPWPTTPLRWQAKRDTALFADDNERSEAADAAGRPAGPRFACPRTP